jgi:hypothetical protein
MICDFEVTKIANCFEKSIRVVIFVREREEDSFASLGMTETILKQ